MGRIRGAGRKTCGDYVAARDQRSTDLLIYGGWVDGFLTAFNQFQDQTYDVTPWQTTELILGMMEAFCRREPEEQFLNAFNKFIRDIFPLRSTEISQIVGLQHGDKKLYHYRQTLVLMEERLKALGYDPGPVDGTLTDASEHALLEFQGDKGIARTGLPDQRTLFELLLRPINETLQNKE